jgi:hypothetical protein
MTKISIDDPTTFEALRQNFTTNFFNHGPNMSILDMSVMLCEARDEINRLRMLAGGINQPSAEIKLAMRAAVYGCVTRFDGDTVGDHLRNNPIIEGMGRTVDGETALIFGMCDDVVAAVLAQLWGTK